MDDKNWFLVHTRGRCEKIILAHCLNKGLETVLPCYKTKHNYQGKTVEFTKPLFPSYLFLKLRPQQRALALNVRHVINVIDVYDQNLFARQLGDILLALETGLEICSVPEISAGRGVRIKTGPLRNIEGWVDERLGPDMVLLRLDFIGQAAGVRLSVRDLELI